MQCLHAHPVTTPSTNPRFRSWISYLHNIIHNVTLKIVPLVPDDTTETYFHDILRIVNHYWGYTCALQCLLKTEGKQFLANAIFFRHLSCHSEGDKYHFVVIWFNLSGIIPLCWIMSEEYWNRNHVLLKKEEAISRVWSISVQCYHTFSLRAVRVVL